MEQSGMKGRIRSGGIRKRASSSAGSIQFGVPFSLYTNSNNDAVGDLPGLIEKLDYINDGDPNTGDDLGADGIWLSPAAMHFFP